MRRATPPALRPRSTPCDHHPTWANSSSVGLAACAAIRLHDLLELARHASPECLDVRAHCALGTVSVMIPYGAEDGLVLFLKAAVVVRSGERYEPKPQRPFIELSQHFGQFEVLACGSQQKMKLAIEHHH